MKLEYSEGSSHYWSYRLKDDNGHVLMQSAGNYKIKSNCEKAVKRIADALGKNLKETVCVPLIGEPETVNL